MQERGRDTRASGNVPWPWQLLDGLITNYTWMSSGVGNGSGNNFVVKRRRGSVRFPRAADIFLFLVHPSLLAPASSRPVPGRGTGSGSHEIQANQ
jgi:hypothetical protein